MRSTIAAVDSPRGPEPHALAALAVLGLGGDDEAGARQPVELELGDELVGELLADEDERLLLFDRIVEDALGSILPRRLGGQRRTLVVAARQSMGELAGRAEAVGDADAGSSARAPSVDSPSRANRLTSSASTSPVSCSQATGWGARKAAEARGTAGSRFVTNCPSSTPTSIAVVLSGGRDIWIDNRPDLQPAVDPIAINGGIGDDSINGASTGSESISGGDGNDSINGDGGNDTISAGIGDDDLDDGDGRVLRQTAFPTGDTLIGGSGDDTLSISEGQDTAMGEEGNDRIVESDVLPEASRAPFADTVDGGSGRDTFSLVRDRAVSLRDDGTSAQLFSDGNAEEVVRGMEEFNGGRGGDTFSGALVSLASTFNPSYDGREGPDVVTGGPHPNAIAGGNGIDRLRGLGGDDDLDAKAGEPVAVPDELIDCGSGTNDDALIDLLDAEPISCETVDRSAIGEGPHLVIGAVRRIRGRSYAVGVRCPRRLRHRCRGTLELALTRRGLRPARGRRYSIRAGRRRTLRVRVTRRDARRLRRRRARRGFVRSVRRATSRAGRPRWRDDACVRAGQPGLEPGTSGFGDRCTIQLCYCPNR